MGNYQITEKVNWGAGIIRGWDNFDNAFNKHAGYLGTLTITGDNKDSLAWVQVFSLEPTRQTTMGPRWTPLPNVTVRPNFRCDWCTGQRNSEGLLPFDAGKKSFQQILGTDVIMTFSGGGLETAEACNSPENSGNSANSIYALDGVSNVVP